MKLRIAMAFLAVMLLAADKKAEELIGTWTVESVIVDGTADNNLTGSFTFMAGGKMTAVIRDEKHNGTYTIDPSKTPKVLDLIPGDGDDAGKTYQAIYVIDGDTLKICGGATPGDARPTEVSSKEGSKQMLITLKREKK
jgi:uncharacterized protein (TIGR03067 family)